MPAPDYKSVTFGVELLPDNLEASLMTVNFRGIEVRTDSMEMHDLLRQAEQYSEDDAMAETGGLLPRFHYLTKQPLPFEQPNGRQLQGLTKEYPGDIYMSPDLQNTYFEGIDKIGTLMSMCYGIRALHLIKDGRLGLHAALLHDRREAAAVLLIGKNRSGKSTVGAAIEQSDNRFELLSDDWTEVGTSTHTALPVSPVFSFNHPGPKYKLAFESFGKKFYVKTEKEAGIALPVKAIVEIRDSFTESDEDFISHSLKHIPLVRQIIDDRLNTSEDSARATARSVIAAYGQLRDTVPTNIVRNKPGDNSIADATASVRGLIR